jgi:hypothetical protein
MIMNDGEVRNILDRVAALYSKVLTWYFSQVTKENHTEQQ